MRHAPILLTAYRSFTVTCEQLVNKFTSSCPSRRSFLRNATKAPLPSILKWKPEVGGDSLSRSKNKDLCELKFLVPISTSLSLALSTCLAAMEIVQWLESLVLFRVPKLAPSTHVMSNNHVTPVPWGSDGFHRWSTIMHNPPKYEHNAYT